jgi:hypothetical protein
LQDADAIFRLIPGGQEGLVSGGGCKDVLMESGLDTNILRQVGTPSTLATARFNYMIASQIWDLADIDKDGFLDKEEFAVCWYLIRQAQAGKPTPATLPLNITPPSKRPAA